jgi:putative Mg2+ transporter-C (MgtC) family protein
MPGDLEIIFRLVLASLLGGFVGLEREVHGREAGVRTYLLVALGSALIMIISEYFVYQYEGKFPEIFRVDPGRIAAQAITGIGFLGAGVILRYKGSIRGLTTAACMWVVCAMGLAIGTGYYLFGSVVSAITIISLVGLKGLEKKLSKDRYKELVIVSGDVRGQMERIQEIIDRYHVKVTNFGLEKDLQGKEVILTYRLRLRAIQPEKDILGKVFELDGIKRVTMR